MFYKEALPVRLQINRGVVSMPRVRAQAKNLISDKKRCGSYLLLFDLGRPL